MNIHLEALILRMLLNKGMHGHQIITELKEQSDDFFNFQSGTVYPLLQSLEKRGLITAHTALISKRERKVYNITDAGKDYLLCETKKWHDYCRAVDKILAI